MQILLIYFLGLLCGIEFTLITIRFIRWSVYEDLKIEREILKILNEEEK